MGNSEGQVLAYTHHKIDFFVEYTHHKIVVLHVLSEQRSTVTHTRIFHQTGQQKALILQGLVALNKPAWWVQDGDSYVCLL